MTNGNIRIFDFSASINIVDSGVLFARTTFAYEAPELVLGLPPTPAVDYWSLGCVMVAMITGHELFRRVKTCEERAKDIFEVFGPLCWSAIYKVYGINLPIAPVKIVNIEEIIQPTKRRLTADELCLLSKLLVVDPDKRIVGMM